MPMQKFHKYTVELEPGHLFSLAGTHYHVLEINEVDNADFLQVIFAPVHGTARCRMVLPRDALWCLI